MPEPWLRGTLTDVPAVGRAVLHALELAQENLVQWCSAMQDEDVNARPAELPSYAFHVRHIAGSVDRLLTYAEGRQLSDEQLEALKAEPAPVENRDRLMQEFDEAMKAAVPRIHALAAGNLEEPRSVGRLQLPTTVGGLLVHVADHTQRHTGQAVTTAKVVLHARSTAD